MVSHSTVPWRVFRDPREARQLARRGSCTNGTNCGESKHNTFFWEWWQGNDPVLETCTTDTPAGLCGTWWFGIKIDDSLAHRNYLSERELAIRRRWSFTTNLFDLHPLDGSWGKQITLSWYQNCLHRSQALNETEKEGAEEIEKKEDKEKKNNQVLEIPVKAVHQLLGLLT